VSNSRRCLRKKHTSSQLSSNGFPSFLAKVARIFPYFVNLYRFPLRNISFIFSASKIYLYHFWLFKAINTSLYLENLIFSNLDKKGPKMQIMLTHSLTELEERAGSYWSAMKHSKLFWVEMAIFIFMIIASIVLFIAFWFSGPN